jgi:hypothetical protein
MININFSILKSLIEYKINLIKPHNYKKWEIIHPGTIKKKEKF